MKSFCLPLIFIATACSTQVTQMADGRKLINNNLLSQGVQVLGPDGILLQSGNAEVAAKALADYGRILRNAALYKTGIDAVKSLGNNVVDTNN